MENARKPLIAANWKMHKTQKEVEEYFQNFDSQGVDVVIAVSPALLYAAVGAANSNIAAQNMYVEEKGAFTGETSPLQILDAGVSHVIIGHSERRHVFGETQELLTQKLLVAEKHGLTPIYCVGETLEQRNAGDAERVVLEQLHKGIDGLQYETIENMVIAYEPVWAIGTGETATAEQAEAMHAVLRAELPDSTRILYGGSVKPENAAELFAQPSIDGFLVGGASLEPQTFMEIIAVAA